MTTVPLARRLAGPSFSLNVRYDQAFMTKRRTRSSADICVGKNVKTDFTSEYEVFDVAEGEILVSKFQPGRLSDGYARCFSTINGWQKDYDIKGKDADSCKRTREALLKDVQFIGVAVTPHKSEKIQKFDQGFVACVSGVVTVVNESGQTLHPGMPLAIGVCQSYPRQHGIHNKKIRFCFRKAEKGDDIVGKALSYSHSAGSTVDILLHPQRTTLRKEDADREWMKEAFAKNFEESEDFKGWGKERKVAERELENKERRKKGMQPLRGDDSEDDL